MDPVALQIPLDQVASQKIIAVGRISEIGCSTADCKSEPTHVALVAVVLANGHRLSMITHYCETCSLVATHSSGVEA